MEKRKGISVLLLVQQKIFGMYCTFHIASHCHSLRSRKHARQQSASTWRGGRFESPDWVEAKMEEGSISVTDNNYCWSFLSWPASSLNKSNCMNMKLGKINRPCAVVWQLLLLLLEIVGGRLCPVEQVMTCGTKNPQTAAAAIWRTLEFYKLLYIFSLFEK